MLLTCKEIEKKGINKDEVKRINFWTLNQGCEKLAKMNWDKWIFEVEVSTELFAHKFCIRYPGQAGQEPSDKHYFNKGNIPSAVNFTALHWAHSKSFQTNYKNGVL